MKHDILKEWLEKDAKKQIYCSFKVCDITPKKTKKFSLSVHDKNQKHQKSVKAKSTALSMLFMKPRPDMNDEVATAEIRLSIFFVEHQVPLAPVGHLVKVCKETFSDCKISQKCN